MSAKNLIGEQVLAEILDQFQVKAIADFEQIARYYFGGTFSGPELLNAVSTWAWDLYPSDATITESQVADLIGKEIRLEAGINKIDEKWIVLVGGDSMALLKRSTVLVPFARVKYMSQMVSINYDHPEMRELGTGKEVDVSRALVFTELNEEYRHLPQLSAEDVVCAAENAAYSGGDEGVIAWMIDKWGADGVDDENYPRIMGYGESHSYGAMRSDYWDADPEQRKWWYSGLTMKDGKVVEAGE